ncbi:CDGSH iron-sulfur domain-containing protein 3, mitochondrial [Clupea harengus]|uniref:CDGSH iron-sulfur domain-containing protein 3, mitochondrial n=1 Tax=Clupea harengus TaxID=7950 RepID=A0A6P3WDE7_CLUHA|nr:CDGSH iron-sulfur domain-containing protein 3, mitochondrial [Clupea harengus]
MNVLLQSKCVLTSTSIRPWMVCLTAARPCSQKSKPAVASKLPYRVKLTGGKRHSWCACGHSKKQPFCDGSHKKLAPDLPPLRFVPEKDTTAMLCGCKHTANPPYCDGTHFKVIFRSIKEFVLPRKSS